MGRHPKKDELQVINATCRDITINELWMRLGNSVERELIDEWEQISGKVGDFSSWSTFYGWGSPDSENVMKYGYPLWESRRQPVWKQAFKGKVAALYRLYLHRSATDQELEGWYSQHNWDKYIPGKSFQMIVFEIATSPEAKKAALKKLGP